MFFLTRVLYICNVKCHFITLHAFTSSFTSIKLNPSYCGFPSNLPILLRWHQQAVWHYIIFIASPRSGNLLCRAHITCNPCFVFRQGPRCPAKCRDRTTAPAPAGEARILNKGNRYRRNRSGSKHSPKRRRPRSRVKPLLNFQLVPRGKERQKAEYGPEELQRLFVKLKASPLVPRGVCEVIFKRTEAPQALSFQTSTHFTVTLSPQKGGNSHLSVICKRYSHSSSFVWVDLPHAQQRSLLHRQHHQRDVPPPVLALIPQKRQAMIELCNCVSKRVGWGRRVFYNNFYVSMLHLKTVFVRGLQRQGGVTWRGFTVVWSTEFILMRV